MQILTDTTESLTVFEYLPNINQTFAGVDNAVTQCNLFRVEPCPMFCSLLSATYTDGDVKIIINNNNIA